MRFILLASQDLGQCFPVIVAEDRDMPESIQSDTRLLGVYAKRLETVEA